MQQMNASAVECEIDCNENENCNGKFSFHCDICISLSTFWIKIVSQKISDLAWYFTGRNSTKLRKCKGDQICTKTLQYPSDDTEALKSIEISSPTCGIQCKKINKSKIYFI